MNIINLEHINKIYGEKVIFEDASFGIQERDKIGIVGINGTGKSTLLKVIAGEEVPDSGQVIRQNGLKLAFVPQNPVFPDGADIRSYALESGTDESWQVESNLTELGITDFDQKIEQLSGGQKRRVAIAGVLAMKPEVLILDEPTAGLDPAGRDEILDLIARMHKEKGITVILVSHSMEDVAKYVERIIVMNHGQVMFDNTPCEVFKHYKELEQIGLAAPQVTYLMHELKEKGLNVNTEATTVAEARESLLEVLLGREPNHRGSNLEEENLC